MAPAFLVFALATYRALARPPRDDELRRSDLAPIVTSISLSALAAWLICILDILNGHAWTWLWWVVEACAILTVVAAVLTVVLRKGRRADAIMIAAGAVLVQVIVVGNASGINLQHR